MNFLFRVIFAGIILLTISSCSCTYYVVRHADKGADGLLTQDGFDRADDLWQELADKKIDAIYTTQVQRTQQTAQTVVDSTGLTPIVIQSFNTPDLISNLRGTSKKSILVVGHSNTVPVIVDSLMVSPQGIVIPETDYDNLFIIKVSRGTSISRRLTRATYGEISQ